jgi:hypothetical protein
MSRPLRCCNDKRPLFRICHIVDEDGRALCFDDLAPGKVHPFEECEEHRHGLSHSRCRRCIKMQAALEAWDLPDALPQG